MAASIPVEEESGRFSGRTRRHNGYYAGDFSRTRGEFSSTPTVPFAPGFEASN